MHKAVHKAVHIAQGRAQCCAQGCAQGRAQGHVDFTTKIIPAYPIDILNHEVSGPKRMHRFAVQLARCRWVGKFEDFLFIYLNKLEGDKYKNPVEPTKDETILKDYVGTTGAPS